MREYLKFYIDGQWVDPVEPKTLDVDQPGHRAGRPARSRPARPPTSTRRSRRPGKAFADLFADQPRGAHRPAAAHPGRISEALRRHRRRDHRGDGRAGQRWRQAHRSPSGMGHLADGHRRAEELRVRGTSAARRCIVKEPIGVCGLITPWNWPINQIACKVVPGAGDRLHHGAQAVRSRAVLGARSSPRSWMPPAYRPACTTWSTATVPVWASRIASHPDIDMVSFTGSTRAGVDVAKNAAATVKRVTQELGGKSPNIILDDADFAKRRRRRRSVHDAQLRPVAAMRRPGCSCRSARWTKPSPSPREPPSRWPGRRSRRQGRDRPGGHREPSSTRSRA